MSATDPAYDIFRSERQPLAPLFTPQSLALIGASEELGSMGRTVLGNLLSSPFGGTIYPVHPTRQSVLGVSAYPNIGAIPTPIDLAIITKEAPQVPQILADCVRAQVKSALVMSGGFRETGATGMALEKEMQELVSGKIRLIGPNSLGIMNPPTGFNATYAKTLAKPGNLAFITQSGALATTVLDWSFSQNVGFSAFVCVGSMLDVSWGDLIYYLGDDPHTHSIVLYMESVGQARTFLSAAREVALTKPIVVLKAGQTEVAAIASQSHTGIIAGEREVLSAAFRRCGVLEVNGLAELFDLIEVLAKGTPLPKGPQLTIITNAGAAGILATDALVMAGGNLATLAPSTLEKLETVLPRLASHPNPIDILDDATPERYLQVLEIAQEDSNTDGLLVILTPQLSTQPTATAQALQNLAQSSRKPILASWMGDTAISQGELLLNESLIATYRYPDAAARLFCLLWQYSYNLQALYETPTLGADNQNTSGRELGQEILQRALSQGRTILTEMESKEILAAYGIPVVPSAIATSAESALELANRFGYPVVLKLLSQTIVHKTEVGGIQLNLTTAEAVVWAYQQIKAAVSEKVGVEHFQGVTVQPMLNPDGAVELILGSSIDPQFGPILLFGTGGQLVEVFQDVAIALPPLNSTLARRLLERTKIYTALKGVRGRKEVNLRALEDLLVKFSQLVVEQPHIKEIDLNPLLVSAERLTALDAAIVLHPADTENFPQAAIRPYPSQYVWPWQLKDGTQVIIRPIRPEDEPLMVKFHESLSEQSIYFRYFHLIALKSRVAHERLTRICFIDYDREMALVVVYPNPTTREQEILGVGRLSKLHGVNVAEFAMLIRDNYQRQGLGSELLKRLVALGREEKLAAIRAEILPENRGMQKVCEQIGFRLQRSPDIVKAEIVLGV